MADEIRRVSKGHNRHKLIVQNVNSMFQIFFTDKDEIADVRDYSAHVDRTKFRDFALKLMDKGVYMSPVRRPAFAVVHRPHRGRYCLHRQSHWRSAGRIAMKLGFIGTGNLAAFFVEGLTQGEGAL